MRNALGGDFFMNDDGRRLHLGVGCLKISI